MANSFQLEALFSYYGNVSIYWGVGGVHTEYMEMLLITKSSQEGGKKTTFTTSI